MDTNKLSLPLYDTFYVETFDPVTNQERDELVKSIKKLNRVGMTHLYTLIRFHQLKLGESVSELPFGAKCLSSGIKFNLEDMPDQLIRMLISFTNKHLESQ